jgi:hypothetical protein
MATKIGEVHTYLADKSMAGIDVMVDFKAGDTLKIGDMEFAAEIMKGGEKVMGAKRGEGSIMIKTPGAVKKGDAVLKL